MVTERQPDGFIAPREQWLPRFLGLTDSEADQLHQRILRQAANVPGIDETLEEGDKVYVEFIEMLTTGQLGSP